MYSSLRAGRIVCALSDRETAVNSARFGISNMQMLLSCFHLDLFYSNGRKRLVL